MTRKEIVAPKVVKRLESGVPGLDTLLNGGFLSGGMYLFLGPPGSGKTVLGNQICFHHVKESGGKVVYMTLLAESHGRMIGNLSSFSFFREASVDQSVLYLSGYHALDKGGLEGLLKLVAQTVRDHKATLLMIDGVTTIGDLEQGALAFRRFTHELNTYIANSGCTAFLLSSLEGHHSKPEHTMVDGIVALHHRGVGLRASRQIEVRKFRGSSHFEGRHFLSIGDEGIHVIPRAEAFRPSLFPAAREKKARAAFDIAGLDKMLGGGVVGNSITTLIGAAGTGKTILGLHFLQAGAERGEQGLHFGFYETPDVLIEKAESLNLKFHRWVKNGKIEIVWHPAVEQELDELGELLMNAVRKSKVKRIVIDGVDGFRFSTMNSKRINRFLVAIVLKLKAEGVTVLLIEETSLFSEIHHRQVAELAALNESILFLRHVDLQTRTMRVISIMKVRSAVYDPAIRELMIAAKGVEVLDVVNRSSPVGQSSAGWVEVSKSLPVSSKKPKSGGK